ncbi:ABC transporter ATP-binding protein [Peptoniphilus grossensis]|uniref:ABC transporter ATP-binding protein n=1 Tax=Peptoniphilus grossensis TaxID=1465756 RepID=UPI0039996C56
MKLEVSKGFFKFKKTNYILRDINFSLVDGDVLSVLGPNGVGKTTLIKSLTGLLPWTRGETFIDGKNISAMKEREVWSKISYIPQKRNFSFSYTGLEMVLFGSTSSLNIFERPSQKEIDRAREVMKMIEIDHLADKVANEMSGGELQMLLIARSLVKEPKIIILDEPESGLDYKNQIIILDLIKKLSASGVIIVMNTHYPDHALKISNKCLLLNYDKTYKFGETREVLNGENLKNSFSVEVKIEKISVAGKDYESIIPLGIAEERK